MRPYDTWGYLSVDAVAQEEHIVVWLLTRYYGGNNGVAIWDDASLTAAPAAATATPLPTPRATRPAPVPFDANALYDAMLQVQSDMVQMGGLLDRLMADGSQPCEPYLGWYASVMVSPVYEGVSSEWGWIYGEYLWAVEHVLDSSHTVDYQQFQFCSRAFHSACIMLHKTFCAIWKSRLQFSFSSIIGIAG